MTFLQQLAKRNVPTCLNVLWQLWPYRILLSFSCATMSLKAALNKATHWDLVTKSCPPHTHTHTGEVKSWPWKLQQQETTSTEKQPTQKLASIRTKQRQLPNAMWQRNIVRERERFSKAKLLCHMPRHWMNAALPLCPDVSIGCPTRLRAVWRGKKALRKINIYSSALWLIYFLLARTMNLCSACHDCRWSRNKEEKGTSGKWKIRCFFWNQRKNWN